MKIRNITDFMSKNKIYIIICCLFVIIFLSSIFLLLFPQLRETIVNFAENFAPDKSIDHVNWNVFLKKRALLGVIMSFFMSALFFTVKYRNILNNKYDIATLFIIVLFSVYFFIEILISPVWIWGESDDFKIASISIVNHLSTTITDEDIEQCKREFPEENFRLDNFNVGSSTFNGKLISFYFPIYSIVCLPIKKIISMFPINIPLNYCFLYVNLIFYIVMLLFVLNNLKEISKLNRMIVVFLLAFSPAMEYINAPTYEVFLYSLVACSAILLYRKSYIYSALLGSIAASANIAISGFVFFIIISYIYEMLKSQKKEKWFLICFQNIKNISLLAVCCLPILIQLLYFRILIGSFSPVQNAAEFTGIIPRFFVYLFDFNLSFFAYYPLLLIIFIIGLVYFIKKKQWNNIFFVCGILFSMLIYSVMVHINCGQESMHRYNVHILGPFLIFLGVIITTQFPVKYIKTITITIITSLFISNGVYLLNSKYSHVEFYTIPKIILNNIPQLYNPYPYTFISRTLHIDGGYLDLKEKPYFYFDDYGFIRKILVTRESAVEISSLVNNGTIVGSTSDINMLNKKIINLRYWRYKNTNYINLSGNAKIKFFEPYIVLEN